MPRSARQRYAAGMIGRSRDWRQTWVLSIACASMLAACAGPPEKPPEARDAMFRSVAPLPVGSLAADYALQQVGQPYRYGGKSPGGFDCSGLVYYAYGRAGKPLPRTTAQLWTFVEPVGRGDLERGDLLFFAVAGKMQHVGLYLGDGRFVHAPASGRSVTVASLDSGFYRQALLRAGRPP